MLDMLKLLTIFVLILVLLRWRVNLGVTMLSAATVLGLAFGVEPLRLLFIAGRTVIEPGTVTLVLVLALIMVLENVMRTTGMMGRMTASLTHIVGDQRVVMAMMPALLGFLPSAGGARFSAPMVEEAARHSGMSAERKAFVNYWFRHIWEFTWPLYPTLIFSSQILGIPIQSVVAALTPFTLLAVALGIPFAFAGIERLAGTPPAGGRRAQVWPFVVSASPIVATVLLVLGFRLEVTIALTLVVIALLLAHRYGPARLLRTVREAVSPHLLLLVIGVTVFKSVLDASGATQSIPLFLSTLGIASVIVVFVVPFLLGISTGFASAPVAIGFPVLSGLLLTNGRVDHGLLVVAFVAGFAGVMLSPAHLCLILTTDHFKTDMMLILRRVLVPEAAIIAAALAYVLAPTGALFIVIGIIMGALLALPVARLVRRLRSPATVVDRPLV